MTNACRGIPGVEAGGTVALRSVLFRSMKTIYADLSRTKYHSDNSALTFTITLKLGSIPNNDHSLHPNPTIILVIFNTFHGRGLTQFKCCFVTILIIMSILLNKDQFCIF